MIGRPLTSPSDISRRLWWWQASTISLMVVGYAGYYLCRSDLAVAMPLLIQSLSARGMSAETAQLGLGTVASLGVLAYAIGKFPSGGLADFLGGRRNFLTGMGGSIAFTVLFALGGGLPVFTLAWIGNRLTQSLGWAGIVKIASKWFPHTTYGTVMGVLSLSFLFGDAAARAFMGALIDRGVGWRGVFFIAAATLAALLALNAPLLKESPAELGLPEPPVNPENLFGAQGENHRPGDLASLLRTFARSGTFWLVCLVSFGATLVRETFNLWTPTYFTQVLRFTNGDAATKSALFPLFGGVSVILAGIASDVLGRNGRAAILFGGLALAGGVLWVMGQLNGGTDRVLPVVLVALVGFLTIGPYSYLAGAMSLDFGGKQGSATASGLIDGIGYFGGVLAGNTMAALSIAWGWRGAFRVLAGAAWLSSVAAGVYLGRHRRPAFATESD